MYVHPNHLSSQQTFLLNPAKINGTSVGFIFHVKGHFLMEKGKSENCLRFRGIVRAYPIYKSIRLRGAPVRAVRQVPSMLIAFWEATQQLGTKNT